MKRRGDSALSQCVRLPRSRMAALRVQLIKTQLSSKLQRMEPIDWTLGAKASQAEQDR